MDWVSLNSAIEQNRTPNFVWVRFTRRNRTQSNSIHWIVFDWVKLFTSSMCSEWSNWYPQVLSARKLLYRDILCIVFIQTSHSYESELIQTSRLWKTGSDVTFCVWPLWSALSLESVGVVISLSFRFRPAVIILVVPRPQHETHGLAFGDPEVWSFKDVRAKNFYNTDFFHSLATVR